MASRTRPKHWPAVLTALQEVALQVTFRDTDVGARTDPHRRLLRGAGAGGSPLGPSAPAPPAQTFACREHSSSPHAPLHRQPRALGPQVH